MRDDGFRYSLQRRLRGKDEALTKVDEGGHVQEEERREDRLRQERQAGTRVRNVRLQGPFPGERPAHHRCPTLEPGCGIAAIPQLPARTEQGVSFRIDDPAKDSSASKVADVPVDVREGNHPDDVLRTPPRSAGDEDRKRKNASAARKIPGRPDEYGKRLPRPGPDPLEVLSHGQIAGVGQGISVPFARRVPPHPPPLRHDRGETEDFSP